MKLNSPIVFFTVFMFSLIVTLVISYFLPLNSTLTIPLFIIGFLFIVLGIMQETKRDDFLTSTPTMYVIYGGLMVTISTTILTLINSSDVRLTLLVLIVGTTLTVVFSHIIDNLKGNN